MNSKIVVEYSDFIAIFTYSLRFSLGKPISYVDEIDQFIDKHLRDFEIEDCKQLISDIKNSARGYGDEECYRRWKMIRAKLNSRIKNTGLDEIKSTFDKMKISLQKKNAAG